MTTDATHPHPHLRVETDGPVRVVTLDRPDKRNAQTPSLWRALADEARNLPDEVRVVVLRGAGDAFSAGIDTAMFSPSGIEGEESMAELASQGPGGMDRAIAAYQEGFTAWGECPAVVVAQVHGYAIGAGFQLALAADLRVASTRGSRCARRASGSCPTSAARGRSCTSWATRGLSRSVRRGVG